MKIGILKWISLFVLSGIVALGLTVRGAGKTETILTDTCFIYTDGLLDDMCAIEYLSKKYDNAIIFLQNPTGLADNQYASDKVTDETSFFDVISKWFTSVASYHDSADILKADLYLLAPLTEWAELLKDLHSLESKRALMMAGDADGPDGAGGDWNAIMDLDAYRYVTENMTDLIQITRSDCEKEFVLNGYPFDAQFLDEYITRMNSINESVCCYDLQAVALLFK